MNPNSQPPRQNVDPFFIPKMLWGALLTSSLLFVFLAGSTDPFDFSTLEGLLINSESPILVFIVLGLIVFAVSYFLPRFIFQSAGRRMAPPTEDRDLVKRVFLPLLLRLAMGESIMLLGFLAAGKTQNAAAILPFLGATLLIFLFNIPTREYFRSWVRR